MALAGDQNPVAFAGFRERAVDRLATVQADARRFVHSSDNLGNDLVRRLTAGIVIGQYDRVGQ